VYAPNNFRAFRSLGDALDYQICAVLWRVRFPNCGEARVSMNYAPLDQKTAEFSVNVVPARAQRGGSATGYTPGKKQKHTALTQSCRTVSGVLIAPGDGGVFWPLPVRFLPGSATVHPTLYRLQWVRYYRIDLSFESPGIRFLTTSADLS